APDWQGKADHEANVVVAVRHGGEGVAFGDRLPADPEVEVGILLQLGELLLLTVSRSGPLPLPQPWITALRRSDESFQCRLSVLWHGALARSEPIFAGSLDQRRQIGLGQLASATQFNQSIIDAIHLELRTQHVLLTAARLIAGFG